MQNTQLLLLIEREIIMFLKETNIHESRDIS